MRTLALSVLFGLISSAAFGQAVSVPTVIPVPPGTRIELQLPADLTGQGRSEGDLVQLLVNRDVQVPYPVPDPRDGSKTITIPQTVLARGTPVSGRITKLHKNLFGTGNYVEVTVDRVTFPNSLTAADASRFPGDAPGTVAVQGLKGKKEHHLSSRSHAAPGPAALQVNGTLTPLPNKYGEQGLLLVGTRPSNLPDALNLIGGAAGAYFTYEGAKATTGLTPIGLVGGVYILAQALTNQGVGNVAKTDATIHAGVWTVQTLSEVQVLVPVPAAAPAIADFNPRVGPAGTTVTIKGQGFTSATGVKFNGVAAAFNPVSSTEIVATVPDAALTGTITVTTATGTGVSAASFTVGPAPAITSFTPATAAVGTVVSITGTDFTGVTSVKFNGVAAGFRVDSPTQITATVPTGALTGPVSITTTGGTGLSAMAFTVG